MATTVRRTRFNSSTLVRLVADLDLGSPTAAAADVESKQTFAQRLSGWLDWTQAIALAGALGGSTHKADQGSPVKASVLRAELRHLRETLSQGIAAATAPPSLVQGDLADIKRACVGQQREMDSAIGPVRALLRRRLTASSPALAQLAALDAVMEQALAVREKHLLGKLPAWLEARFEQQRTAAGGVPAASVAPEAVDSAVGPTAEAVAAWWSASCSEAQAALMAELDVRLQPLEGLLEALEHAAQEETKQRP